MNRIELILKQNGPMLSGSLAKAYEKNTVQPMKPHGKQYHVHVRPFKNKNFSF